MLCNYMDGLNSISATFKDWFTSNIVFYIKYLI